MTISYGQTTRLIGLMLCIGLFATNLQGGSIVPDSTFDKALIKPRVENLDFFVRTRYNSDTERHIRGFVVMARKTARRVLGESTIYFPTIEKKIAELGLPDDLKYLTVVESMLDPKAASYAGAKGMWQLMPFIAEDYDIEMGEFRDDRFHIEKSAHAGLSYLKNLYDRFENWELALAAYNCGANRVKRVLKQTGKKTYWGIRHLLPRQTREFVPKLVAVKYLFDYYQHHGIEPAFPSIDLQLTQSIEIQAGKSYADLGQLTDLTSGEISFLNPSYMFEPKYADLGKIEIILPSRVANAVIRHLDVENKYDNILYRQDSVSLSSPYYKVIYAVPDSMTLSDFCKMYNLSTNQVWLWNELASHNLFAGQEIFVYGYKDLMLEYKIPRVELMDLEVSRLEYTVSLIDTIPVEVRRENIDPVKGSLVAFSMEP